MITVAMLAWLATAPPKAQASGPTPSSPQRVGDAIKEPKKLKNVPPSYPEDAQRAGLQGIVFIECVIDPKGKVDSVKVLKGVPPLTDAATKAVKQWRYTPTLLNGVAIPVIMTVTTNFHLEGQFDLNDLLHSLKSNNEFIREAAVTRLGGARLGSGLDPGDLARIDRELKGLAESDPSERVQTASRQALEKLPGPK